MGTLWNFLSRGVILRIVHPHLTPEQRVSPIHAAADIFSMGLTRGSEMKMRILLRSPFQAIASEVGRLFGSLVHIASVLVEESSKKRDQPVVIPIKVRRGR